MRLMLTIICVSSASAPKFAMSHRARLKSFDVLHTAQNLYVLGSACHREYLAMISMLICLLVRLQVIPASR
jgi:hypothetical protein